MKLTYTTLFPLVFQLAWKQISASTVCYHNYGVCDLGCYTDEYPYSGTETRPVPRLPRSPDKVSPDFYFDNKYVFHADLDPSNPASWKNSGFNPDNPLKIIVHGWFDMGDVKWVVALSEEFIKADPTVNVIRVDWVEGSRKIDYTQSATDTQTIGSITTCLVEQIYASYGEDYMDRIGTHVHCIGHSLGAQICGYLGRNLRLNPEAGRPARITGLDPAEPYFGYGTLPEVSLERTDALFVDIVHSDVLHFRDALISLNPQGFGIWEAVGHVDFYPNNGTGHPGCDQGVLSQISGLDFMDGVRDFVACNHMRSHKFFLEGIKLESVKGNQKCKFSSYECNSYNDLLAGTCMTCKKEPCIQLGWHADDHKDALKAADENSVFLVTSGAELDNDFCSHSYTAKVMTGSKTDSASGKIFIALYGTNGKSTVLGEVTHGVESIKSTRLYQAPTHFKTDVGTINKVKVVWEDHDWSIRSNYIYVDYVEVFDGDQQKLRKFCNFSKMSEGKRYSFHAC